MCAKNKLETSTHTPPCRKSDFAMAKQKKQSKQKKKTLLCDHNIKAYLVALYKRKIIFIVIFDIFIQVFFFQILFSYKLLIAFKNLIICIY